jgi:hypothetical protein
LICLIIKHLHDEAGRGQHQNKTFVGFIIDHHIFLTDGDGPEMRPSHAHAGVLHLGRSFEKEKEVKRRSTKISPSTNLFY